MQALTFLAEEQSIWSQISGFEIVLLAFGGIVTLVIIGVFVYVLTRSEESND